VVIDPGSLELDVEETAKIRGAVKADNRP